MGEIILPSFLVFLSKEDPQPFFLKLIYVSESKPRKGSISWSAFSERVLVPGREAQSRLAFHVGLE